MLHLAPAAASLGVVCGYGLANGDGALSPAGAKLITDELPSTATDVRACH